MGMAGSGDEFGDRMKAYEAVETSRVFDKTLPIYARIDGRSFSRLTRSMGRPFDRRMTAAMVETTKGIVRDTHAKIGYTQSDEINLVWLFDQPDSEPLFGGKVHKLTSVLASLATAHFCGAIMRNFTDTEAFELLAMHPHFDCRVFQLPSKIEAANAFLWRAMDARKNAVSMATRCIYSPKQMHGKDQTAMRGMLASGGIDFDDYHSCFKWGTWVRRENVERYLSAEEMRRIPEAHRPHSDAPVVRTEIIEIPMPEFRTVKNRVEVIFDGIAPE